MKVIKKMTVNTVNQSVSQYITIKKLKTISNIELKKHIDNIQKVNFKRPKLDLAIILYKPDCEWNSHNVQSNYFLYLSSPCGQ
jgi:hypothetical protein